MPHRTPRIRFADHDTVFEITHLNDMDDEVVASVFFTSEELRAIKSETKTLVRMMEEGLHMANGKASFDTRGLEAHTKTYKKRSRELRYTLYDSIHAAQNSQQDCWGDAEQEDSCDLIAPLSRHISAISTELALATAKEDARAARPNRIVPSPRMHEKKSIKHSHEGIHHGNGFIVTPPTIRRKLIVPGAA